MMNGDVDEKSPKKYSIDLYSKLEPLYGGDQERLKLHLYAGVHHGLKTEMVGETVSWFKRWL
ncbi:MAG: hypothetical protein QMD53_05030 [Actinomycetota bacterium]|nr:hypothetical protein [Actinomycetota bacterium]